MVQLLITTMSTFSHSSSLEREKEEYVLKERKQKKKRIVRKVREREKMKMTEKVKERRKHILINYGRSLRVTVVGTLLRERTVVLPREPYLARKTPLLKTRYSIHSSYC